MMILIIITRLLFKKNYDYNSNFSSDEFYKSYQSITDFQKLFCKSQLLSTYYNERRRFDTNIFRKNISTMLFIADWAHFYWIRYKQNKKKKLLC